MAYSPRVQYGCRPPFNCLPAPKRSVARRNMPEGHRLDKKDVVAPGSGATELRQSPTTPRCSLRNSAPDAPPPPLDEAVRLEPADLRGAVFDLLELHS